MNGGAATLTLMRIRTMTAEGPTLTSTKITLATLMLRVEVEGWRQGHDDLYGKKTRTSSPYHTYAIRLFFCNTWHLGVLVRIRIRYVRVAECRSAYLQSKVSPIVIYLVILYEMYEQVYKCTNYVMYRSTFIPGMYVRTHKHTP